MASMRPGGADSRRTQWDQWSSGDLEPPETSSRVAGGLLGVVGGEVWADRAGLAPSDGMGRVGMAMVDLCHSYVAHRGSNAPIDVALRHHGVPGPGWLLGVAIVRPDVPTMVTDTLELAVAAGIPRELTGPCVTYVQLAACLFAGWSTQEAIAVAGREPGPAATSGVPRLGADPVTDGLDAGIWALSRSIGMAETADVLAEVSSPEVVAAATGLLGLRDGIGALPGHWLEQQRHAAECRVLGPALLRVRVLLDEAS